MARRKKKVVEEELHQPEVADEIKAPEVIADEVVIAEPQKPAVKVVCKRYVATRVNQYHPFARVRIPTSLPGTLLEEDDSWLQCQIEAGLIKEA